MWTGLPSKHAQHGRTSLGGSHCQHLRQVSLHHDIPGAHLDAREGTEILHLMHNPADFGVVRHAQLNALGAEPRAEVPRNCAGRRSVALPNCTSSSGASARLSRAALGTLRTINEQGTLTRMLMGRNKAWSWKIVFTGRFKHHVPTGGRLVFEQSCTSTRSRPIGRARRDECCSQSARALFAGAHRPFLKLGVKLMFSRAIFFSNRQRLNSLNCRVSNQDVGVAARLLEPVTSQQLRAACAPQTTRPQPSAPRTRTAEPAPALH